MERKIDGTQAVTRALRLLKLVARHHEGGVKGATLSEAASIQRVTAYRLLSCLVAAGFVQRDTRKRYSLGLEAMQLGLVTLRRAPVVHRCRPMMRRVAQRTGDTVFLVVRNGDYAQCVHYEEGSFPVKTLVLQVGELRLLGVGSAGAALLASLPDGEVGALHARHRVDYPRSCSTLRALQNLVGHVRRHGYSRSDGLVTEGVSGVGMNFEVTPGTFVAVSVAATSSRMNETRRNWIAALLADELATEGLRMLQPIQEAMS